jgi:hypothetical protein
MYAATWFVDDEPAHRTSRAAGPADWSSVQLGFDEDGAPTIRRAEKEATPLEAACSRQAERSVPAKQLLDAATAIPGSRSKSAAAYAAAREDYLRLARARQDAFRACMSAAT